MFYWYQLPDTKCVTIDYGRYEAVSEIFGPRQDGCHAFTWTPVLAGPQPLSEHLAWLETAVW